jgi:hypothetical protein
MLADGKLVAGVQRVSGGKAHSASRLRKDTQILAVSVSEEFQMQNVKIHGGGGRFTTGTVLGVGCRPPKKDRVLVTGVYVLSNISPYIQESIKRFPYGIRGWEQENGGKCSLFKKEACYCTRNVWWFK